MSYINQYGEGYNFKAPSTQSGNQTTEVQFPVFDVQSLTLSSNAASATLSHTETLIDLGSDNLAAAATVTVTNECPTGSKLYVKFKCGSTKYDVTISDGTNSTVITGVASKTNFDALVFDGTNWLLV